MRKTVALFVGALLGTGAHASNGDWFLHARYRVENVDRDDPLRTATASTLRTSAGYETDPERLFGAMIEIENVQHIGAERFNSTTNGRSDYDVVADPDGTELNQAYLTLQRSGFRARAGRQALLFDNARFVGDVNFRQNQQTYDALTLQATTPGGSRLIYGYAWRVNRFLGEDNPVGELGMRTHLLNYSLGRLNGDRLTAYAYLIEMDELAFQTTSTQTYGASYDGSIDISKRKLIYRLEYANQTDYADNPGPSNAWYGNVEVGVRFASQWTLTAGAEFLSGNGRYGFQTPLATAHKFNGFADVFAASTPPGGIDDRYLRLYMPIAETRVTVSWHDFRSDEARQDYGTELDAEINWRLTEEWLIGVKYADYRSEGFSTDTRKAWVWVQADF